MVTRGGHGDVSPQVEASSELPSFLGSGRSLCRRRQWHRINDTRCMLRRKGHRVSSYSCDSSAHGLPNDDSHDDITLSSDDFPGIVKSRRRRILDDALFQFFSKEAIKSLKRDFSNFCSDSG